MARILKHDSLGSIELSEHRGLPVIIRDSADARFGLRWLARHLARREARALAALRGRPGLPELIEFDGRRLTRSFLAGLPLYAAEPPDARYFAAALSLLRSLHGAGITHNDLAKEANWIRSPEGRPAIVDFQLAGFSRRHGRVFRLLAREDLRHLLKHKRHYLPDRLTARQRALLAAPSLPARTWRAIFKPVYVLVTRRLLGRPERPGAAERSTRNPL